MDGNLLQNIVLQNFCSIFRLENGISRHKGSMEGASMFQGQIGKNYLSNPREIGQFSVLTLFFHLALPKFGPALPIKHILLKLSRLGLLIKKV